MQILSSILSLDTLEFIAIFMIGDILIYQGTKNIQQQRARPLMCILGFLISISALGVYLYQRKVAFTLIIQWAAMIIIAILFIVVIIITASIIIDFIKSEKKKHRAPIVAIINTSDKCIERANSLANQFVSENRYIVLHVYSKNISDMTYPDYCGYEELLKKQIVLADKVCFVGEHGSINGIGQIGPNCKEYAKKLHKTIIYYIGTKKEITDDIVISALMLPSSTDMDVYLAENDYDVDTIKEIKRLVQFIRSKVDFEEIVLFADMRITLAELRNIYNF